MVAMVTWLDLLENFPTKNIRSQVVLTDLHGVDLPRQLLCEKSNIQKNYIICCYLKSHTHLCLHWLLLEKFARNL